MKNSEQQIAIYQNENGGIRIDVRLEQDTVWLRQEQMGQLFGRERSVITKHIRTVFVEGELEEKNNVQNLHIADSDKPVKFYNLDVIISVGYRVKSKQGTQFRIWANKILKQYLIQGYALNEQKLREQQDKLADLRQAIALSSRLVHHKDLSASESQGILAILEKYSHALTVLDDYDHQRLKIENTQKAGQAPITYPEAIAQIQLWRSQEKLGGLFGNEKDDSFKGSLATIFQTCIQASRKKQLICYSFSDGNKRIAAAIFAWFLERHDYLYNAAGEKRIADNALVAFTLLIAESKPEEKDTIVKVIINLINGKNE